MTHPHNGVRFIHEKEDFYELIWSDFQDLFLNEKSKVQTILCIILHSLQGGRKEKQTTNKKKICEDKPEWDCCLQGWYGKEIEGTGMWPILEHNLCFCVSLTSGITLTVHTFKSINKCYQTGWGKCSCFPCFREKFRDQRECVWTLSCSSKWSGGSFDKPGGNLAWKENLSKKRVGCALI